MRPSPLRRTWCLLTALLVVVAAPPALSEPIGATMGSFELSGRADSYLPSIGRTSPIAPFENFEFFLNVEVDFGDLGRPELNATHGIREWEGYLDIPAQITILSAEPFPATATGTTGDRNWILDLGRPLTASATPFSAVHFHAILMEPQQDLVLRIEASRPSRVDDLGPAWVESADTGECTTEQGAPVPCLRVFERTCGMSINCMLECEPSYCGPVAIEAPTWGAWKAGFRD